MRAELANLNHCAVPFLRSAAANLCWYYSIVLTTINTMIYFFSVVKTANDFSVYNNGKRIYHKTFDGSSGDCLNTHINKVTTYVYDSRPMTFYIGNTGKIYG